MCWIALEEIEQQYHAVAVYCSALQCVAVCCSVLQCVSVCCSVLQRVVVCPTSVLVCWIALGKI